jgi:prevent-host-death family protein
MATSEPVNVYEAETHLSKLIDRAMAGDEVVISRSGKPMVRLVPIAARPPRRTPGSARGRIRLSPDFDDLPEEVTAAFRGELP